MSESITQESLAKHVEDINKTVKVIGSEVMSLRHVAKKHKDTLKALAESGVKADTLTLDTVKALERMQTETQEAIDTIAKEITDSETRVAKAVKTIMERQDTTLAKAAQVAKQQDERIANLENAINYIMQAATETQEGSQFAARLLQNGARRKE